MVSAPVRFYVSKLVCGVDRSCEQLVVAISDIQPPPELLPAPLAPTPRLGRGEGDPIDRGRRGPARSTSRSTATPGSSRWRTGRPHRSSRKYSFEPANGVVTGFAGGLLLSAIGRQHPGTLPGRPGPQGLPGRPRRGQGDRVDQSARPAPRARHEAAAGEGRGDRGRGPPDASSSRRGPCRGFGPPTGRGRVRCIAETAPRPAGPAVPMRAGCRSPFASFRVGTSRRSPGSSPNRSTSTTILRSTSRSVNPGRMGSSSRPTSPTVPSGSSWAWARSPGKRAS